MFDITLYGHLTNDTIIDGDKETMSLGGLYNCWRTFNELDRNLQVGLMPTVVGTAEITIDRKTSTRTSKANLNETYLQTEIKPSRISHVLYLNELEDTSFLPNLRGIVSADLCKGRELNYDLLKYVDYLFVSDDEHDVQKLKDYSEGGLVISHTPRGSIIFSGNLVQPYLMHRTHMVEEANVLGAGDMFASCFLYAIHKKWSLHGAIEFAHITTADLIRKYNEKI
jgi:hypothetical protein